MASNYYLPGYGLQPTPKMLALLRKLVELDGILLEQRLPPRGYFIQPLNGKDDVCWYPTQVGRGLRHRGLIDQTGRVTKAGLRALELHTPTEERGAVVESRRLNA